MTPKNRNTTPLNEVSETDSLDRELLGNHDDEKLVATSPQ